MLIYLQVFFDYSCEGFPLSLILEKSAIHLASPPRRFFHIPLFRKVERSIYQSTRANEWRQFRSYRQRTTRYCDRSSEGIASLKIVSICRQTDVTYAHAPEFGFSFVDHVCTGRKNVESYRSIRIRITLSPRHLIRMEFESNTTKRVKEEKSFSP